MRYFFLGLLFFTATILVFVMEEREVPATPEAKELETIAVDKGQTINPIEEQVEAAAKLPEVQPTATAKAISTPTPVEAEPLEPVTLEQMVRDEDWDIDNVDVLLEEFAAEDQDELRDALAEMLAEQD
ncbi:MAG: hypothetical protein AAF529_05540 [Pseudomonadota bacterium]